MNIFASCSVQFVPKGMPTYSLPVHLITKLMYTLLTLGAHAPEGYGSCPVCVCVCVCVSVCVCVCVSVRNLNLGTGASRGLNEGNSE